MGPFLYMELCTIAAYGFGWVGMWNVMDLVSYILQVRHCAAATAGACAAGVGALPRCSCSIMA
jgi:hypothetical protein